MKGHKRALLIGICYLESVSTVAALDENQCLESLNTGYLRSYYNLTNRPLGMDNTGSAVDDEMATAISYANCVAYCGGNAQEPFDWQTFSQQSTSWFLPWLALISQLPFGGQSVMDNFVSIILTIGSPVLAAYSLILFCLNASYAESIFRHDPSPSAKHAVRALIGLQQAPLRVDYQLLAISLSPNKGNQWWKELSSGLRSYHRWSFSALSGIAWVIISYLLMLVDSTASDQKGTLVGYDGPGVAALWCWLLPVVVGWLLTEPICDAGKVRRALKRANAKAGTVLDHGITPLSRVRSEGYSRHAIGIADRSSTLLYDEVRSPPIFNYSRFFSWNTCVERVAEALHSSSLQRSDVLKGDTNSASDQTPVEYSRVHMGSQGETEKHHHIRNLTPPYGSRHTEGKQERGGIEHSSRLHSIWDTSLFTRMGIASVMALLLQWCTAGAAAIPIAYTPTAGLGCRAPSYLLYAMASTIVWFSLISSSILAHYSSSSRNHTDTFFGQRSSVDNYPHPSSHRFRYLAGQISRVLNAFGKSVAGVNAFWIVFSCILHFANVYKTCSCSTNLFSGGGKDAALTVLALSAQETTVIKRVWLNGLAISLTSIGLFIGFIWRHRQPAWSES